MIVLEALTVTIAVVRGDFLTDTYMLDDTERNVTALAEQLHVMIAIMLSNDVVSDQRTAIDDSGCRGIPVER